MTENEQIYRVVREWVLKAEHDLITAAHTLKLGRDCPGDTVAFHAQQVCEKYLKAILVLNGTTFQEHMTSSNCCDSLRHRFCATGRFASSAN